MKLLLSTVCCLWAVSAGCTTEVADLWCKQHQTQYVRLLNAPFADRRRLRWARVEPGALHASGLRGCRAQPCSNQTSCECCPLWGVLLLQHQLLPLESIAVDTTTVQASHAQLPH
jgi:hypothetical protein